MVNKQTIIVAVMFLFLSSCFVQSPKYTSLEKVQHLQLGMDKAHVEEMLGLVPYDIKSVTDTSTVYIYVYRVIERQTFSLYTKPLNGKIKTGKYVQLAVGYSKADKVISIESCSLCPDNLVTKSNIDFSKIAVFFTVTVPAVIIYFGLQQK